MCPKSFPLDWMYMWIQVGVAVTRDLLLRSLHTRPFKSIETLLSAAADPRRFP